MALVGVHPSDVPDDEDLCASSVRKPKLVHEQDQDDISDYARSRLLVARALALKRYQEKWA